MQSQSLLPQMQGLNQYSLTGGHPQRSHPSQMLTDQSMCRVIFFLILFTIYTPLKEGSGGGSESATPHLLSL